MASSFFFSPGPVQIQYAVFGYHPFSSIMHNGKIKSITIYSTFTDYLIICLASSSDMDAAEDRKTNKIKYSLCLYSKEKDNG